MNYNIQGHDQFERKGIKEGLLLFARRNIFLIITYINKLFSQLKAHSKRELLKKKGLHVPPILTFTITRKCNLNCIGCYQKSHNLKAKKELSDEKVISLFEEARELGISIVFVLGGEPFMRDIFKLTERFKDMFFLVYTNSTLINKETIEKIKRHKQIIPLISIEGCVETDKRRGAGVFEHAMKVSQELKRNKLLFGVSITVTRNNVDEICSESFVHKMANNGSSIFAFFEYLPFDQRTKGLTLTDEQRKRYLKYVTPFRDKYKKMVITSTLEQLYGGCLGAGRGLFHINYDGSVEPCPFAPYSDINVENHSLKECLQSPLFTTLQKNHDLLEANNTKCCTLFENKELLEKMGIEKHNLV